MSSLVTYQKQSKSKTGRKAPQYNDYKDVPPTPVEVIDEPEIIANLLIQNGLVPEDKTGESVIQGQHLDRTKEPSDKLENNQTSKTGKKLMDSNKCKYCLYKPKNGGIGKLKKSMFAKAKEEQKN